jgi:hypothetical protein
MHCQNRHMTVPPQNIYPDTLRLPLEGEIDARISYLKILDAHRLPKLPAKQGRAEMALALVLLASALLLIRTFVGLSSANPGIDPRNVLTLQTSLACGNYSTTETVDLLPSR